jgi:transcriptional regulator with XRE-family HTH domain
MGKKLPENLPDVLRKTRERYGLEQEDLARLLQVTTNTLIRWENGSVQPTGDNRKRLELWVSLTEDPRVDGIILRIMEGNSSGALALGGFFGLLAGVSGMVDRMGKGLLEDMLAPDESLMVALHEFHGKGTPDRSDGIVTPKTYERRSKMRE